MPLKRCVLRDIHTLVQFYNELARQLAFPAYFGRNLDALWDVLSGEVAGPFEIVWEGSAQAQANLGVDYAKLIILLNDLVAERDDFTFTLR
ncbi:barnase inhibitor barstar [Sulfuricella denitrificans skB26]|uniref:Barnase inhibitor barstar n=1 Tax=Sulfuricella denitrificans (strain DSM 22764 / NBRC 105220 / skB26) TaxID=1163617 RepID=S6ACU6_SULDS|nr:barstar family protein [Sulfuricella denitrificans]BAN35878.1 barnase inhibitor barstar [Sulfuricella denitrificans skB26]